jgi:hypothetical protein
MRIVLGVQRHLPLFCRAARLSISAMPILALICCGSNLVPISDPTPIIGTIPTTTSQSVQLALSSVSPNQLSYPFVGSATLQAVGNGFTPQSSLVFNGVQLSTTETNSTQLSALLPASLVTQPGPFTLYVWDSDEHTDKSNSLTLDALQKPSIQLTATPATLSINQWVGAQSSIAVLPQGGFSGNVTFSVTGLPRGISASFSPLTDGTSTLSIQATDDLQPGIATVTVIGSDGNLTATTTILISTIELPVVRDENGYCDAAGKWVGPRFDSFAELPRTCFDTDLNNTPSPGPVTAVVAGGNLQTALNAANCGDTVSLQAGASFSLQSGSLPSKGCDGQHWITVRTSAPDSALPPEHSRINPSYAGVPSLPDRPPFGGGTSNVMARIVETSLASLMVPGDHYRFIGIEITRAVDGEWYNALISTQTTSVIFDRCWIHGDPIDDTTHLVEIGLNTDHLAVINSYLNDAHCKAKGVCTDSQDVTANNGGSTLKIVNNFLEAASESILFGGGTATAITSDIEVRLNHLFKPMSWNPNNVAFIGTEFIVKDNFEMKEGQRVLVEGNILENTWGGFTQDGWNILLTPKDQQVNGTNVCPICFVADVTLRYNYVRQGAGALSVVDGATANGAWSAGGYDYSIHDLIFDAMQYPECYKCGFVTNEIGGGYDAITPPPNTLNNVSIDHITLVNMGFLATGKLASGFLEMNGPPANNPTNTPQIANLVWNNSIMATGSSGAYPWGGGSNNCSVGQKTVADKMTACWTAASSFAGNVMVTNAATQTLVFPIGNQTASTWDQVDFVNFNGGNGGDYLLSPSSPYKGSATDGADPGADVTSVMAPVPFIE